MDILVWFFLIAVFALPALLSLLHRQWSTAIGFALSPLFLLANPLLGVIYYLLVYTYMLRFA